MKSRVLGKAGPRVSEIGLSCWQLGGDWSDTVNKDNSFAILQAAIDNGMTFFDTADVYGAGLSEEVIGEFLRQSNAQVTVATKFGRAEGMFPDGYSEGVNYAKL